MFDTFYILTFGVGGSLVSRVYEVLEEQWIQINISNGSPLFLICFCGLSHLCIQGTRDLKYHYCNKYLFIFHTKCIKQNVNIFLKIPGVSRDETQFIVFDHHLRL